MAAIMKIVLGHNAAADFSEILRGKKAVFTEVRQRDRYPRSTDHNPNAVWASASGVFSYRLRYTCLS